ncbi:MAG: hypothetical protein IJW82_06755 [Clostridia bacterium]|nr:hypothetical protein [Clostridia bacterium]
MIFDYGTIYVDVIGKWNVHLNNVSKPKELREFL